MSSIDVLVRSATLDDLGPVERIYRHYRHTVEESVYVAPWGVGRGIGRALLEELLRRCVLAEVREVIAVIAVIAADRNGDTGDTGDSGDSGDTASVALHRRCGFVESGRLAGVGHKHGRWLDTILMQRSLVAEPNRP